VSAGITVTDLDLWSVCTGGPPESVTVRVTVNVLADGNVCTTLCPVPVVPSPKVQLNVYGVKPPLAVPENVTV